MKKRILSFILAGLLTLASPLIVLAEDGSDEQVANFINSTIPTENTAIYAQEVAQTCGHVDGPLVTEQLDNSTVINYNPNQGGCDTDSYIGSAAEGVVVDSNDNLHAGEVIQVGEGVTVAPGAGTANHTPAEVLNNEAIQEKNQEIEQTLKDIAEAGQELIEAGSGVSAQTQAEFVEQIKQATEDLAQINVTGTALEQNTISDAEFKAAIATLVKDDRTIINISTEDRDYIFTTNEVCNSMQNYQQGAENLYWNFGDFKNTLTFTAQWGGVIVAPNATIVLYNGVQAGRVIGAVVSTRGEVHLVTQEPTEPIVVPPSEPEKPPVEPEDPPTKPEEPPVPPTPGPSDEPKVEPVPQPPVVPKEDPKPSVTPVEHPAESQVSVTLDPEPEVPKAAPKVKEESFAKTITIEDEDVPLAGNMKIPRTPKTGDSNLAIWLVLILLDIIGLVLCSIGERERRNGVE